MKSRRAFPLLLLIFILAAGSVPCGAYSTGATGFFAQPATVTTSAHFEAIRHDQNELRAFFLAMPKGGDLHNHLTGAVYAEDVIDISARHGIYVDPSTTMLYANATIPGLVPVSSAYDNATLYTNLVDSWSMRDYPENTGSGRQWFFRMFGLIGPAKSYPGELVAAIRNRAAQEHVMYIETMMHVPGTSGQEQQIESRVAWNDDFGVMHGNLLAAGMIDLSRQNAARLAALDTESRELSTTGGKNVTIRYIYEAGRVYPKKDVFTDLVLAFETANQSPLVAGINFVGEENSYYARSDYRLHMQMIGYLHSVYPRVPIALHAGEQTTGLVPPEDLRFHIAEAIDTAHATRIGHGVDIMYEDNAENTLAEMADRDIPVEILLTSNDQILHVTGPAHPVSVYLSHHVPVIIATDDPGVERTDLTEQYVLLALQHPELSYQQIRTIDENSIRYSFLPASEKETTLRILDENIDRFETTVAAGQVAPVFSFFSGKPVRA
jgi:adenosine deaminase